jgi:hypothetical protein
MNEIITAETNVGDEFETVTLSRKIGGRLQNLVGRVSGGVFEEGSFGLRGGFVPSISGFTQDVTGATLETLSDKYGAIPGYVIR